MKILLMISLVMALIGSALALPPTPKLQDKDVIDTMMTVQRFDTFLMLVRESDTAFALKRAGPYTVFAPTDEAMANMSSIRLEELRSNPGELRRWVLAHVVRGRVTAEEARRKTMRSLSGTPMRLGSHVRFDVSNVMTSNGILHGISATSLSSGR